MCGAARAEVARHRRGRRQCGEKRKANDGLGQLLITAIHGNDLPMVQTLTFIFAILIVVFTLVADILYGVLDPRIRYD